MLNSRLRCILLASVFTLPSTAFSQVQVNQVFNQQGPAPSSGPLDTVDSGDAVPNGTVAGAVQAVVTDPADPKDDLCRYARRRRVGYA